MIKTSTLKALHKLIAISIFISLSITYIKSQELTQNISGQVLDKQSQQPLPGANIILVGSKPIIGTTSDVNGYFKLPNVPIGRKNLAISFVGYNTANLSDLILTTGKELNITVELEEQVTQTDEVVVKASKSKEQANNEMATVSARSFTVEETEKYAGSRGDVARMASNFAGVSFANDSRNDIVIRGNSPSGVLWRLEDVDIPNPNHFAENGTTGGPVGMLNNNTLRNSDFYTGAFPAEYGNALSGVFDLKMRNGNSEKHEFLGEIGFNGFELGAEGPISKENHSSYLVDYRYSTLGLVEKMGINIGTTGIPYYQDISYKINIPMNKGLFTVFGLGGISSIDMLASKMSKSDMYASDGQNLYNFSSMFASGASYTRFLSEKTYAKFIVSGFYEDGGTNIDTLDANFQNPTHWYREDISESRLTASFILNTKFNSQLTTKFGVTANQMAFGLHANVFIDTTNSLMPILNLSKSLSQGPQLFESYYEATYKISNQLAFNPGVQFIYFDMNHENAFEPRAGLTWSYARNRKLSFGYGLVSHSQPLSVYYYLKPGSNIETNKNLDFTKSHQFVIGHDWNITDELRLKTEVYYQYLFSVPVQKDSASNYSILNSGAYWGVQMYDNLINSGKGYNYGLELTFEKFLSHHYYFLLTSSLFDSKYRGSDGVLRNTAFNSNYVVNALFGGEYPLGTKTAITTDIKIAYSGGMRYIPINETLSVTQHQSVYDYNQAFDKRFPDYLKVDFKVGFKINHTKATEEWSIYIENITNHNNYLLQSYSSRQQKVITTYQLGFFPMMQWKINF